MNLIKLIFAKIRLQSIQTQTAIAYSCLIVFILGTMASISYYVTGSVVEKNSGEYVYQLVNQVNHTIQYYLDNVTTISQNIYANWDVQNYINKNRTKDDMLEIKLGQYLDSFVASRTDILNIAVFTADGRTVVNNPKVKINPNVDFRGQSWYKNAMATVGMVVSESRIQNIFQGDYRWVISCSHVIKNTRGEKIGVVLIDLNFNLINDMVSKITLGRRGYVFIIDGQGNIVYHPKQQLLYSGLKQEPIEHILTSADGNILFKEDGIKKQYTITSSRYSGWKVIGAIYIDDISDYRIILQNFFIAIGLVSLIIYIVFSVMISKQILHPIKELAQAMHGFEEGGLDLPFIVTRKNEIGDLGKAFNSMKKQIKLLIRQNRKEQELKRKNELKALQAQINPHFLYNTLDSIVWLAEEKKYDKVVAMTSSLAKLFRISISKGEEFIPVEKEVEHVVNYLKIQKIWYEDKFEYSIAMDPAISGCMTIKLILQPIVENAICHGIKNLVGNGKIDITVEECCGKILFTVVDDGVGIATLEQLVSADSQTPKNKGVGIRNVDDRIKLYFGHPYGIEIESEPDEGTLVKIWLPKIPSGGIFNAENEA